jgi:hypothetical protein
MVARFFAGETGKVESRRIMRADFGPADRRSGGSASAFARANGYREIRTLEREDERTSRRKLNWIH